jgi:glycine/sarcosine N-methyltransferase
VSGDEAAAFYDDLASEYDLIFGDWDAAIAGQAGVIGRLFGTEVRTVLDASCGIGTQALGLAAAGLDVTATDISPRSVARCAEEASARGLTMKTAVADLRALEAAVAGPYDAVISFDNSLPHLDSEADLRAAMRSVRRVLRPGGRFLGSIRDYDALLLARPSGDPPRVSADGAGERIVFQVWDWKDDRRYLLRHFVVRSDGDAWQVSERRSQYRAVCRDELTALMRDAGFAAVHWSMPEESGYYQPIFVAQAT